MRKIRELGSLPADAFEKYHRTASKAVSFFVFTLASHLFQSRFHFCFVLFLALEEVKRSQ